MKCLKQPKFLQGKPVQITNILEIRLASTHWHRIKIAAAQRGQTYSTITRYCVLRLARKCSLRWTSRLHKASTDVLQGLETSQEMHRHTMCLYGDDEKVIRLAAMDLGLTITALARLAIELYLETIAMEKQHKRYVTDIQLTSEGIRFTECVQIFAVNGGGWPCIRSLSCIQFDPDTYW